MLIQKELEAKIMSELNARLGTVEALRGKFVLHGSWQQAGVGLVRWIETDATSPVFVMVSVGTPDRPTFSSAVVNFAVNASVFVRTELDPDGSLLVAMADAIQAVIDDWQSETYQAEFTRFDIPGLSVDGISVQGGTSPTVQGGTAVVSWPMTFSGSYREIENKNS